MKRSEIFFSSILVPLDYILIVLAGISAYFVRYSESYATNIREVVFSLPFPDYFKYIALLAIVWIIVFALSGLYSMNPSKKIFDVINKIFLSCSTGALIVIIVFFFSRELFSSRFIILAGWILSFIYISLAHLFILWMQKILYQYGVGIHRVVLIGGDNASEQIAGELYRNKKLGYEIIFRAKNYDNNFLNKIKELFQAGKIDEIIQADVNFDRDTTLNLINLANEYHLDFKYAADLLGANQTNIDIKTISGLPIIEIKKTPLDGWGKVVKRIFDIIGSLIALIIFSPIFLLLPLIIKLDSRGPVFYKNKRVGAKGKKFTLYKFRSMIVGADKMKQKLLTQNERPDGPLFKISNDPRLTRVGRFIRRTSLDEFPNFWNVLIGHMSLIGPRPHEPHEVAKYAQHHKKLLNIKPGITGLAQVSGRSTLDFETEVKLDTLYIETWSLKQDIIILLKTPFVVFFDKTAV